MPPRYTKFFKTLFEAQSENDVTLGIASLLNAAHPKMGYRTEVSVGGGRADLIVGGVVIEVKRPGGISEVEHRNQLCGYLDNLKERPRLEFGDEDGLDWKGILSDGRIWYFYEHEGLGSIKLCGQLDAHKAPASVWDKLQTFINPKILVAPPVNDDSWVNGLITPFFDFARKYAKGRKSGNFEVKQRLWSDLLAGAHIIPPNDADATFDLFIRHTFLVVLARLVGNEIVAAKKDVTSGFPAWIPECHGDQLVLDLQAEINKYKWNVGQDILKDLYHTAVPSEIRHDFGEYYTPDWLAEAVVEEVCDDKWVESILRRLGNGEDFNSPQVIDPSCGSGTFIYAAVKRFEAFADKVPECDKLLQSDQNKAKIFNRLVGGIDLHPIAVELAQTTKLLALGCDPGESLHIWLGDSLQWHSANLENKLVSTTVVDIPTSEGNITLPTNFVESDAYEQDLNHLFETVKSDSARDQTTAHELSGGYSVDVDIVLEAIVKLRGFRKAGRNGVWQWYLENIVQPYRFSRAKPTRLVGNPPWVVSRNMSKERQDEFRKHAKNRGIWTGGNLATQNDLAALFVATVVDFYLADNQKFGFVLPHAALKAGHWELFRSGNWDPSNVGGKVKADLSNAWNMQGVKAPPFRHSDSCVIFGKKMSKPIALSGWKEVEGTGIDSYSSWSEVREKLVFLNNRSWPSKADYYSEKKFRQGAILGPKSLVITKQTTQGSRAGTVAFLTEDGKSPWTGKSLGGRSGEVERSHVHRAIFSTGLLPFGIKNTYHLIAPIENDQLLESNDLSTSPIMKRYWNEVSMAYHKGRSKGSPDALNDNINYNNKLVTQLRNRGKPCLVVYNTSGSNLYSAVIEQPAIVDSTLYYYCTDDDEAHYLAAILNARCLNLFFKEACRKSNRHFHLWPVKNLPIQEFDNKNKRHNSLADLSRKAHNEVKKIVNSLTSSKTLNRKAVLNDKGIEAILSKIDVEVSQLFPSEYMA